MKKIAILVVALCHLSSLALGAESADVIQSLKRITNSLTQQYVARNLKLKEPAVAVFPINSDEKLAKQNVGFALSEMLTHQFVQSKEFTVVERLELVKVLGEQKLQQSGAIDPAKAVEIGKMVGARFIVLGSVEKVNGKYLLNSRMVDEESSAVIATAYEEFSAQTFEEDAKPYLALVPEEQTLGFYGGYNFRGESASLPTVTYPNSNTLQPETFDLKMWVAGLRYFPTKHFNIDLAFMGVVSGLEYGTGTFYYSDGAGGTNSSSWPQTFGPSYATRALLGWKTKIQKYLWGNIGAGFIRYRMTSTSYSDSVVISNSPIAQGMIEFRPQERIGLSLAVNYEFDQLEGVGYAVPQLSFEPALAIYF